jgi:hypothetical protein
MTLPRNSSTVASGNQALSASPGEERTVSRRATTPPPSQEEAENELSLLKAEILDIQGQLAKRKTLEDDHDPDYRHWKGMAVAALRAKEARHTFLKHWINEHRLNRERRERTDFIKSMFAEVITALEHGEDSELALNRLIAWRDAWLNDDAMPWP